MRHIFFVPGIFGTKLKLNGKTVWPPSLCKVFSDDEVDDLMSDDVVPGPILSSIGPIDIYGPIIDALTAATDGKPNETLVLWPYDWRRNLIDISGDFAAKLATITGTGDEIVLIAHSMGGLIVRGALENPANKAAAWQAKVKMAVFLATPHEGATDALAEVTGLEAAPGFTKAQSIRLNSSDKYPAAYQLLPPLDAPVFWSGPGDTVRPFGSNATWTALGLRLSAMPLLTGFRKLLNPASRPSGRRYVAVVSSAHETVVRVLPTGTSPAFDAHKDPTSGDGTVRIQSATALNCQTLFVTANHIGVSQSGDTHAFLLQLLGLAPEKWAFQRAVPVAPTLSVSRQFLAAGDPWEIVIKPRSGGMIDGSITIQRWSGRKNVGSPTLLPVTVQAAGQKALSLNGPPLAAGQYQVQFHSKDGTDSTIRAMIVRP